MLVNIRVFRLQELNVYNNGLGDKSIQILLDGVINNKTIIILDLSKNFITNASVDKICEIIQKPQIKELYIHWNQIKVQGGIQIFKQLCENKSLKVFDISWNSMGSSSPSVSGQFCEFLKQNKTIVHLDISNNNLSFQEAIEIQKVLNFQNKSIYGLHFFGNYGYIDNNGFLQLDQNQHTRGEQLQINRIKGVESVNSKKQKLKTILSDVCWICDGWQEAKFQWIPGISGDSNIRPIYIHLEFEDFRSRYMGKMDSKYRFNHKRMIPFQSQTKYYFTVENKQTHALNDEIQTDKQRKKHYIRIQDNQIAVQIKQMNKLTSNNNLLIQCIDQYYKPQFSILPRTRVLQYRIQNTVSVKKWSIPISVFKDWKTDNDDLLKKCFEFDWNNNKLQKFIKKEDELNKIKNLLKNVYPQYKECYKHYASLQPLGDVWALQNLTYFELVNKCGIMDGSIQEADVNLKWTSTVSGNQKGNFRMPERGMIRCQMMEAIVRIGEEKYLKSGICGDLVQATEKILNDNFNIEFQKYNSQQWRNKVYWTQQCDECLKYYKQILENIFKQFSIKKVKPGQKNFMCLDELNDICKFLNLYEENFVERDTFLAFNLSMMTQVDEISLNRIFEMSYIEFLEASARISEKKCLLPYGATDELSYNQRQIQPLHVKLEALCIQYLKLCDQSLQASFKLQQKSIFTIAEKKNETDSD